MSSQTHSAINKWRCWKSTLLLSIALACSVSAESSINLNYRSPLSSSSFAPKRRPQPTKTSAFTVHSKEIQDKSSSSSAHEISKSLRGGQGFTPKGILGALWFIAFDVSLRKVFKDNSIEFPSMMAGCVSLFIVMVLAELSKPGLGESAFQLLSPGANLLAKWLPVFFVPGLAMLPLAPKVGSSIEVVKVLATIILGWFFTILTTGYSVQTIRTLQGKVESESIPTKTKVSPSSPPPPKPFSEETVRNLAVGSVVFGVLSTIATRSSHSLATPIQTLFMACATIGSFVYGARLPKSFTSIVHPLVTSTVITLVVTQLSGKVTGQSFEDVLRKYKAGSLSPMKGGAGDILLFMLGPSVVSLSMAMYSRKALMKENLLVVLLGTIVSAVGGLFGTAAFVRFIKVASKVLRCSVLPRNVTTALAMAISGLLDGNVAITASTVVLTGIIGGTFGARLLSALGMNDPVTRGLAIGSSSQGLGVASIVNEKDAFPFAAIAMVLTAVWATSLVSVTPIKDALVNLATGGMDA